MPRPRTRRFDTRDSKGYAHYLTFMDQPVPPGYVRIVYENCGETGPTHIVAFVPYKEKP